MDALERIGWLAAALVLAAFSIPWFLWGSEAVVWGLPIWLWWHIGWMVLASLVFWLFTKRAWGLGVEPDFQGSERDCQGAGSETAADENRSATGGDRR